MTTATANLGLSLGGVIDWIMGNTPSGADRTQIVVQLPAMARECNSVLASIRRLAATGRVAEADIDGMAQLQARMRADVAAMNQMALDGFEAAKRDGKIPADLAVPVVTMEGFGAISIAAFGLALAAIIGLYVVVAIIGRYALYVQHKQEAVDAVTRLAQAGDPDAQAALVDIAQAPSQSGSGGLLSGATGVLLALAAVAGVVFIFGRRR